MSQEITTKDSGIQSLDDVLLPVKETIQPLEEGENVLIEYGNTISLLKYEGAEIGSNDPLKVRANRHTNVYCLGNLLFPQKGDPLTDPDPSKKIEEKARAEILGTHRIDFNFDDEFGIHIPSAEQHTDLYLELANKYADNRVESVYDKIDITTGDSAITDKLKKITRPQYFEQNVLPFIENRTTDRELPGWNDNGNFFSGLLNKAKGTDDKRKPIYRKFNKLVALDWFSRATNHMEHGSFVYVGCNEEVYLLGVAKDDDGKPYMQGTYNTSTKPMFWFSNNLLGHMSAGDMNKPLFKGQGLCNVAVYRTSEPPGFNGEPFIFTAMGRTQDCKNHMFTGEPDIITGDLSEALSHFRTTDFNEFEDIVKAYATKINEPNPSLKPKGEFFY